MTTKLLQLKNRFVTDTGEIVLSHDLFVKLARDGVDFHQYKAETCEELVFYNRISKKPIDFWVDDGEVNEPSSHTKDWTTPEPYASMNVWARCEQRLEELQLDGRYAERLMLEIGEMELRDMLPVLRQICFMVDDFTERKVVWGVGRGSSCASLVLFLLGLNAVDPVKYDIPITDFLR